MTAIPQTAHLNELWSRPEAASAKDAVQEMIQSPGWKVLIESIEARLRTEQRTAMRTQPREAPHYDRMLGRWAGLSDLEAMAEGIVEYGKSAEAEMRSD